MARPALDPAFKADRLVRARAEAARLNKKLPPRVYAFATAHGRVLTRYEPPTGRKIIIRNPFPSAMFYKELGDIQEGVNEPPIRMTRRHAEVSHLEEGTWRWLCYAYFKSLKFKNFTLRDQRVRRNVLERTCNVPLRGSEPDGDKFGDMHMSKFKDEAVAFIRDHFSGRKIVPDEMFPKDRLKDREVPKTPESGNSAVKYIRGVFDWAMAEHKNFIGGQNWAHNVKYNRSGEGHRPWGEEQCAAFTEKFPVGTRERLVYDLARLTGQRLSDLARLGPSMIRLIDGKRRITFIQAKGRRKQPVIVTLPYVGPLEELIEVARKNRILGKTTFIAQEDGKPYAVESLGNMFGEASRAAGIIGYPLHGLRKTSVIDLVEAGCEIHEIMAITGHRTIKEIERYSRDFMRASAAERAISKLRTVKS